LKIEAQIRKVEQDDIKKLKIIGKLTGVKVPSAIPSNIVDLQSEVKFDEDEESEQEQQLLNKVGYPKKMKQVAQNGCYFMSNELS
jgi:hypothetical protein